MGNAPTPTGTPTGPRCFWEAPALDPQGLVFDFTDLKRRVKNWIDDNWDHAFLVNSRDTELIRALASLTKGRGVPIQRREPVL